MRSILTCGLLLYALALQAGEPAADTWIVSGQSNACGRAPLPGYDEHPQVQMFAGGKWAPAKEPLPLGGRVGPWLAAAVETAKASGFGMKLTGWAQGGQPIGIWDEGGTGWRGLKASIQASGKNAGVFLWYQGESDAAKGLKQDEYEAKLTDLIARVRKESGTPALQVVIVQISRFGNAQATTMEIREAQRQVVLKDPHALLVTAIGRRCDGVHLYKDGYFELGAEIARALLKTRYGKKDVDWPGPVMDAGVLGADGKTVGVHFAEVGKLAGVKEADFGAIDAGGMVKCVKAQAQNTVVVLTLERAIKLPARVVYGFGQAPEATLVDEAGNRAPAVMLDLSAAPLPPDQPTKCPNGAGLPAGAPVRK
ncbi:MAG: sialate O-acetylesterase [Planctomycetota bacterium]|nr:sialate O-acetylesterase [Planctomycetota bacterium]